MLLIYGLTGLPCAGKGTAAALIARETNAPVFVMSDELRAMLRERGIQPTRSALQSFVTGQRRLRGNAFLAEIIAGKIDSARDAVVDGLRSPEEAAVFRKAFPGNFLLVAVAAPLEKMFERSRVRGRENEPSEFAGFKKSVERETAGEGFGIAACAALADARLDNSGSREQLEERVRALIRN
ncbi:MAG: AAA family ATPase [Candidatus Micrarchaeia archaeon]